MISRRDRIKRWLEKWYMLFMMIRISRHNKMRMNFETKYKDLFDDYGQDTEHMTLEKCHERDGKLFKYDKDKKEYEVARAPQKDDFGLYEYVDQHCGYCEDDFYGTIYTKTPIKGIWIERGFSC